MSKPKSFGDAPDSNKASSTRPKGQQRTKKGDSLAEASNPSTAVSKKTGIVSQQGLAHVASEQPPRPPTSPPTTTTSTTTTITGRPSSGPTSASTNPSSSQSLTSPGFTSSAPKKTKEKQKKKNNKKKRTRQSDMTSPHASAPQTPALLQSSATTTTTATVEEVDGLPPVHLFDIVPPLHDLLARLLIPAPGLQQPTGTGAGRNSTAAGAVAAAVAAAGVDGSSNSNDTTNLKSEANNDHVAGSSSGGIGEDASSGAGHLEIHNLAAAASAIKVKIQKARQAVMAMPDIDRSIDEQEAEIAELEDRIAQQTSMLKRLRQHSSSDTAMDIDEKKNGD